VGIESVVNVDELRGRARRRLPRVVFDYLDGGAEDETTLAANRRAWQDLRFRPRLLPGAGGCEASVEIFGRRHPWPLLIAPTGLNGIFWPDADRALARAAEGAKVTFCVSTAANRAMESLAEMPGPKWFQLYPWGKAELSARLMQRAAAAGYEALIVTVDSLVPGKRERDLRNRFSHKVRITPRVALDGLLHPRWLLAVWLRHGMPRFENIAEFLPAGATADALADFTRAQRNPAFSWDDLARLREQWKGPLLLKGVLSGEDADRCVRLGLDGVVVSNHGGRQLDGAVASRRALPEVVAAGKGLTVLVDGGIRRGADVAKALALGARGVLVGRAPLYGLAAAGEAGAARALAILQDELERTLRLLGCLSVQELGPHLLDLAGPADDLKRM